MGKLKFLQAFFLLFSLTLKYFLHFIHFTQFFLISAIFLEYFCSTLLFIFTSIITFHFFPEPCNFFKKRKLSVTFSYLITSHWGRLTSLCVLSVLCHILWDASPPFVTPIPCFSGHIFSALLEEFLFFLWDNFLFYADCAVLVNHCCSFLKGWYGRERPAKWAGSATTSDFSPNHGLVSSLSREVTQPSMVIDVGLIAFQMWGQMSTSSCSSPLRTAWDVFFFSLSLALLRFHCSRRPRVLLCRESGRLCASRLHPHGAFWDPHLTKFSLTSLISQVQIPANFLLQNYFSCFFPWFQKEDWWGMVILWHMPRGGFWIHFSNWISWSIWSEEARAQRTMQTGSQPTNSLSILISIAIS